MLPIRNFFLHYWPVSGHIKFVIFIIVTIFARLAISEQCATMEGCKCKFQNGSIVDLSSLSSHGKPRWSNMKPTLSTDNYTYFFNPCFNYSIGNDGGCPSVEVCQTSKSGDHFNCGNIGRFWWDTGKNSLTLTYVGVSRMTNVTLVCSPEAQEPTLVVIGETRTSKYEMTLTSRCACADLCREDQDHLSAGSVLVILFMIGVALYLVLGIIHSSLTRGAHGWELIPHYEFWVDFPLLIRDGCVFAVNGCKPDTAYERI